MTDYIVISLFSTFLGCMLGLSLMDIIKHVKATCKKKEAKVAEPIESGTSIADAAEKDLNDYFAKQKAEIKAKMDSDIYRANAEIFTKIYVEKIRKPAENLRIQLNKVRSKYYDKYWYAASVEEISVFKCKYDFVKDKYFWNVADDRDFITECFIGDEFTTEILTEEQITDNILRTFKQALDSIREDQEWLEKFAIYKLGDTTYNILDEDD